MLRLFVFLYSLISSTLKAPAQALEYLILFLVHIIPRWISLPIHQLIVPPTPQKNAPIFAKKFRYENETGNKISFSIFSTPH